MKEIKWIQSTGFAFANATERKERVADALDLCILWKWHQHSQVEIKSKN